MSSLIPSSKNTPDAVRAQLARDLADRQTTGKTGRRLWRSLEELSNDASFGDMLKEQHPRFFAEWDPLNRRDFLRLMGASLALGGLTSCTRQPNEKIIPYVKQPENLVPGKPDFYATTMPMQGYGIGLLATSHAGRPTKLDGNELHPASLGGSDALIQAAILDLYDPDRTRTVLYKDRNKTKTWDDFFADAKTAIDATAGSKGEGIHILTGRVGSPTLAALLKEFSEKYPSAGIHQYEPINRDLLYAATTAAYGEKLDPVFAIESADVIVSLDADFLATGPGRLRYARDFTHRRSVEAGNMNRLYVVESQMSVTGSSADHRLALTPDAIEQVARAIAQSLGIAVQGTASTEHAAWAESVADDLRKAAGKSLVIAGEQRSPALQALAFAINEKLGNIGNTIRFVKPAAGEPVDQGASLGALVEALKAGSVKALFVLGANPAYHAPADFGFDDLMDKVPLVVHHGLLEDETSFHAHYVLPGTHFLEAWSDAVAYDGTASIVQPLIEPLYEGRSAIEVLATLLGRTSTKGYDLVRETWSDVLTSDLAWNKALHDGLIENSAANPAAMSLRWSDNGAGEMAAADDALDLAIVPDYAVLDGSFSNNGWMQEMPRPISSLTWDNALLISQSTSEKFGLSTGDMVTLTGDSGNTEAAVLVSVGIPAGGAVLHMGYGRAKTGRIATGVGFSASPLRSAASPWRASVAVKKAGGQHELAITQMHHTIAGRNHLRVGTVDEFATDKNFVAKYDEFGEKYGRNENAPSIYPDHDYSQGPQWGMVIDLAACIGCNACMIACQAENNIPVVGKEQVINGREMHWIRVDHYYEGNASDAAVHHQPMTCVHCENAPCEAVCPVAATVHSTDGLNQMVYNRCVGTRYCSNNCPYKVRRFNFYKFADHETPSLKLQRNPNVTVRARGVMEKCTFCIQRISDARIKARLKNAPIADGEVVTACQQACPTKAIVFGDIRDPMSHVSRKKASTLDYGVLTLLNTRPRLTYHPRMRNPNVALEAPVSAEVHGHG